MKKFNIAALIGAVALVVLSFTGCPTTYSDRSYDCVPVGDVIGDFDGNGIVLTKSGITATASFTYANSMSAWGGGNGVCNWKIRKVAGSWPDGDYGFSAVTIGTLPAGVTAADGGGGNIQFKGLVDGTTYTINLTTTAPTIVVNLY